MHTIMTFFVHHHFDRAFADSALKNFSLSLYRMHTLAHACVDEIHLKVKWYSAIMPQQYNNHSNENQVNKG